MRTLAYLFVIILMTNQAYGQENLTANSDAEGTAFQMTFESGDAHNHPSLAIWIETVDGDFIQTLYATKSVATGLFNYQHAGELKWEKGPGPAERPAALPYWFHKRDGQKVKGATLPTPENPVPDAYTGATPKNGFIIDLKTDEQLKGKVKVIVELNQPWDVNNYWTNSKYPDNKQYLTSCQPALVFAVEVDFDNPMAFYYLNPIGHSHPYGADGRLYTDLTTFTSALDIFKWIKLEIK